MGAVEFFSIVLPAACWPLVVGLIAWWQRKSIGHLINRVRSGRVFGQEFDAPPAELVEAVEGGASSPEVEEVIRSATEVTRNVSDDDSQEARVAEGVTASAWASLLGRLSEATRNDEDRRRSEIERVMKSSARWGAKLARNGPKDIDEWEPIVRWKDDGEPEIIATRGPAYAARLHQESEQAQRVHERAIKMHSQAERELASARKEFRGGPPASPELRQRVKHAEMNVNETLWTVEQTAKDCAISRRQLKNAL